MSWFLQFYLTVLATIAVVSLGEIARHLRFISQRK